MGSLVYPFILLAGMLQAVQAPMNQRVREAVANPFLADVVLFLVVLASWTVLFILMPRPLPTAASGRQGSRQGWAPPRPARGSAPGPAFLRGCVPRTQPLAKSRGRASGLPALPSPALNPQPAN